MSQQRRLADQTRRRHTDLRGREYLFRLYHHQRRHSGGYKHWQSWDRSRLVLNNSNASLPGTQTALYLYDAAQTVGSLSGTITDPADGNQLPSS